MINLDKIILSTAKTSKGTTEGEINSAEIALRQKLSHNAFELADSVELWFSDGFCYKFKNKFGPTGMFNQFGVWLSPDNKVTVLPAPPEPRRIKNYWHR